MHGVEAGAKSLHCDLQVGGSKNTAHGVDILKSFEMGFRCLALTLQPGGPRGTLLMVALCRQRQRFSASNLLGRLTKFGSLRLIQISCHGNKSG